MDSILIIVFYNDLPNFRMCLYCLNKFWKSKKRIKIVYSLKAINDVIISKEIMVAEINDALKCLDKTWEISISETPTGAISRYDDQQLYKYYHSAFSDDQYTVVFDCKVFCINDINFTDFFLDNKIKITTSDVDSWVVASVSIFKDYAEISGKIALPLSPWVWKNSNVLATLTFLEEKHGSLISNKFFPGSEFVNVFLYTKFVLMKDEYISVEDKNLPIRAHHRERNCLQINDTANILYKAGVSKDEIERWHRDLMYYCYTNPLILK